MKLENFFRKIPIKDYDELPALRSTALKEFLRSPRHYQYSQSKEAREENDGKSHFLLGRLVHAAILEPDTVKDEFAVVDATTRSTKVYKETVEKYPHKGIVLQHELEQASRIVGAVNSLDKIKAIIDSCEKEISAAAKIEDVYCKARLDMWNAEEGHIYDLKTTNESALNFPYTFYKYGYDISSAFYVDVLLANNVNVSNFSFIVVEKNPPYGVMLYHLTEEMLEYGRGKYLPALAKYKQCLRTQSYPGYSLESVPLVPPANFTNSLTD